MPRVGRAEGNDVAPIGQLRSRPGPKGGLAALLGARRPVRRRRGPRSPRLPATRVLAGGGARCRWGRRGVRRLTAVPGSRRRVPPAAGPTFTMIFDVSTGPTELLAEIVNEKLPVAVGPPASSPVARVQRQTWRQRARGQPVRRCRRA